MELAGVPSLLSHFKSVLARPIIDPGAKKLGLGEFYLLYLRTIVKRDSQAMITLIYMQVRFKEDG